MDTDPNSTGTTDSAIRTELDAMRIVGEALNSLSDADARARVLAWAASHFSIVHTPPVRRQQRSAFNSGGGSTEETEDRELPGIARMTEKGFELTVRDLKARSTTDAAIRLAHIVIYAYEKLTGEKTVSSRKVLLPILKEWRAYDGNTRPALANHKGIHRDGDNLSLDAISRNDAETYINEVLDDSVHGTWNPKGRPARRAQAKKNALVAAQEQAE